MRGSNPSAKTEATCRKAPSSRAISPGPGSRTNAGTPEGLGAGPGCTTHPTAGLPFLCVTDGVFYGGSQRPPDERRT